MQSVGIFRILGEDPYRFFNCRRTGRSSARQGETDPADRANAGWMAGFGIVAMALGVALVMLFTERDSLTADGRLAVANATRTESLGPLLASIIAPLLIFSGLALVMSSSLFARKIPGLF